MLPVSFPTGAVPLSHQSSVAQKVWYSEGVVLRCHPTMKITFASFVWKRSIMSGLIAFASSLLLKFKVIELLT